MFSRFLLLLFVAVFSISISKASEPVLVGLPFVIQEKKPEATPLATTTVQFAGDGAGASTEGLSESAANFYVASSGARSFNDTFALRGLTSTPIFGDPAVTFYLDDIPLGGGFTTPDSFGGVSSAQLNRGPGQNTNFGLAGSAGVVRLSTPDLGANAAGQIDLSAGNFSSRALSATAGSVGGGQVDALISAQYEARDGYVYNQRLGQDVDHRESSTALARINFHPIATVKLSLIALAKHAHDGEQPFVPLEGPLFTINRATSGETDLNTFNVGLTAAVSTPWGSLSATSSVNDWRLGPYRNALDFGTAELVNDVHLTQRNYNQELKLASTDAGDFRWHSGVYFSDGSTNGTFTRAFGPFVAEDSSYTIDTRKLAAFGEVSLLVQPAVTLTAGLRIEDAKKSMDRVEAAPSSQVFALSRESTALLPKFELNYTPAPNIRLFGSVGAGFKPGGFSAFTGNRSLAAFGPERTIALEGGISHLALNNALASTVRVFAYDIRGYQIERSFATGSTSDDYLVVNAPKARSIGSEIELTWQPISGLRLSSSFGITQVTLREFTDPYTGQNFSGKQAPYVPCYDFSFRCEYLHSSGWFGVVKWSANGRTYYTESEDITFGQRAYGLLGGRLGFAAGRWRVAAYTENLLNQQYYSSISAGTMHGTPGSPRTQGIEACFAF
jgi:outer membrane receptor protein involved in Fe transport